MGQYYDWINITKKQYICNLEFDNGAKLYESSWVGCDELETLYTLLASDWKDDTIVFLSDEYSWDPRYNKNDKYTKFHDLIGTNYTPVDDDEIGKQYLNMAIYFKKCKKYVLEDALDFFKKEIIEMLCYDPETRFLHYEDYQRIYREFEEKYSDMLSQYFQRDSIYYRYVINHDKKEYIDRDLLPVYSKDGPRSDPFPILMAITRDWQNEPDEKEAIGLWAMDKIEISNTKPSEDYKEMGREYEYLITKKAPYIEE